MKQYKPKEFSEMLNVSVKTLQSWDNQGVLPAYRNPKGRYFVSVLCELEEMATKLALNKIGLGIDLGVKDFATRSDGIVHENINKTIKVKKIEKRLKREQRSLARKFENLKKRGEKSVTNKRVNIDKNVLRVQKLHARLANIRIEYVKSIVTNVVKTKPTFITVEDLNVKGMMKNKHLSKTIAKQSFFCI
ncbi:RNA-guided endonuclease TnpB family protein [Bacillus cereus group sp. TH43LC]|uniref:RNA-guided endonuclease TnpB family protein n=1 Tax=Bacillus TaxID=1386 RepID=UPI0005DEA091|nr:MULTISPECIES: RNA-guided endonuclease TnpB family protein [Bacillus]CKF12039.1 Probable transposase [Streptococcus pneumoniae]MCQ6525119.1 RNA-guided endonuclease TnpB family protein [Bacillus paranthracis]MCU4904055.1 RNA-guided endonuclease TnpB family protein [Bacillus paranthracis]MCU5227091.1 RNA-guided endonuclease TnpB family protein [Bacillus paranthracis]MDA1503228.1 RNA-guided endonuclease TnpB family protein [Bacillus cereus group sp. TH43LC]